MKFFLLILQNIGRNLVRSLLTAIGTIMLVLVVTLVWSVLDFLQEATSEKTANFKAIVTERWRIPSQMPFTYAAALEQGAAREPTDVRPDDSMTWTFVGGSLDPKQRTRENSMFMMALEPKKLLTMMDDLDTLQGPAKVAFEKVVKKLEENRQGLIVGRDVLQRIKKKVGERITITSFNYKDIEFEFEIVGLYPDGRYDQSAAMNRDYFLLAMDQYKTKNKKAHPAAEKCLNLVWLKVPNKEAFDKVSQQILTSPAFTLPTVKVETASSGVASFLEAYRDLFWGMRYLLAPAALLTMSLVIANAISISVRERQKEFAVLKVLGFTPRHILIMVLGEALLIGCLAGIASAGGTYLIINKAMGGFKFPIAFFPSFMIPKGALWWGPTIGGGTALLGSVIPAWNACKVKVSEVFSRVS